MGVYLRERECICLCVAAGRSESSRPSHREERADRRIDKIRHTDRDKWSKIEEKPSYI